MYCYFNGKIIPKNKAGLPIDDIGILRGYACFDFLRTYNGKIFLFNEHWQKIQKGLKFLGLNLPFTSKELKKIIQKLIQRNRLSEASIRLVFSGGKTINSLKFNPQKPTIFILIDKPHKFPSHYYHKGVALKTYNFKRRYPEIKITNYFEAVRLMNRLPYKNFHDVLYCWDNKILEASTANFFLIKKGTLTTPLKDVYLGTTRNLVLKLAKKNFPIREQNIYLSDLKKAEEAFITSTSRGIMPVTKIDNQKIGSGKVGEKTKYLITIFKKITQSY